MGGKKKGKGKKKKKNEDKETQEDDGIDLEEKKVKDVLEAAFNTFSGQGKAKDAAAALISGRQFSECMSDSKVIGGGLSKADVDILWSKCSKGKSKADYASFCQAVKGAAKKRYPKKSPQDAFAAVI